MEPISDKKILFVEDNIDLLNEMASYFNKNNNEVYTASTLAGAKALIGRVNNIDMLVLDVILPDGSGLDILKTDRKLPPVIVLSDLGEDENIAEGFESGVADYVVKPCAMRLLEMRISLRLLPKGEALTQIGTFSINANKRTVTFNEENIPLTASEFNILYFLVTHKGTFFTANEIYERVWNAPSFNTTTIKRHLSTLRQKLKEVSPSQNLIVTEFGKGYRFDNKVKLC